MKKNYKSKIIFLSLAIMLSVGCASPPKPPKEGYRSFTGPRERMDVYREVYEEGLIKPGMTPEEVVALIGLPTGQSFRGYKEPGPCWIYSLSARKDFFIGYGYQLRIYWGRDGRVIEVNRLFVM